VYDFLASIKTFVVIEPVFAAATAEMCGALLQLGIVASQAAMSTV
jgi:hypothetical protein